MKMSVVIVGAIAAIVMGARAVAVVPHPVPPKKQLSSCMSTQMSVNRGMSYYEAMKACKAIIKSQEENLVANSEAKPAHAR